MSKLSGIEVDPPDLRGDPSELGWWQDLVTGPLLRIAAVVIGGTSLMGGRGRIFGTLIGALVIGVLNNALNIMGVSSYYQMIAKDRLELVMTMEADRMTNLQLTEERWPDIRFAAIRNWSRRASVSPRASSSPTGR